MNPFSELTVREAIRSRPLGIGILEEASGSALWGRLDAPLAVFCRETGTDPDQMQHRLASLPANLERQDWRELPLYFLVDHLTANHREFRGRDLPDVHRLLEALRLDFPSASGELDALLGEYKDFRQDFSWHMEEEEEFLFPKILRTEASLRHPDLYPEIFKGSLKMFAPIQQHGPEDHFHALVGDLFLRVRGLVGDRLSTLAVQHALDRMRAYEARLRAHTYVETEILFPRALAMETALLERAG